MTQLSVLDLVPVREGGTIGQALSDAALLAQAAEQNGYKRFWVAEHHAMYGVAGAATSVVLCHIGAATRTILIGDGGIILPNHSPLVIAEQVGALERDRFERSAAAAGYGRGTDLGRRSHLRQHPPCQGGGDGILGPVRRDGAGSGEYRHQHLFRNRPADAERAVAG